MTRIFLYDTTLRDGSQGEGVNFSLLDKLHITQRLDDLGIDFIEGGYPLSNPKDFEYFQQVRELKLKHARVAAFGMTRRKGVRPEEDVCLKALLDAHTSLVTIVGKSWDLHVTEVLGTTFDENVAMIADSVRYCKSQGREVFYDAEHFFDGYSANPDYALRTLEAAQDAGATVVILCDTNGGTLPDRLGEIVDVVRKRLHVDLGIHCHNDSDVATANSLSAVSRGATQVQGTINGIGERCGNADLINVAGNLALKMGYSVLQPNSIARLTEVSRYVYETANMNFRPGQAFVGSSAFAHKGGMHTHAVARISHSYEHINPALVGNERRILLSELSGVSTILAKMNRYPQAQDRAVMAKILNRVQDLENAGYEFEAAEASFDLLVKKTLELYTPAFERVAFRVNIEAGVGVNLTTEATIKVRVGEQVMHTVAEGDGPVDALASALRKALLSQYPRLGELHLDDYKVRVVNARAETAARVRVVVNWRDGRDDFGTVGVNENIVEASWLALVDAFEYKIFKDREGQG